MTQVQNLRIGHYVRIPVVITNADTIESGKIYKVVNLTNNMASVESISNKDSHIIEHKREELSPVCLTESILKECGFNSKSGCLAALLPQIYYEHTDVSLIVIKEVSGYVQVVFKPNGEFLCKLEHTLLFLHELQDLFLSQFRQELSLSIESKL